MGMVGSFAYPDAAAVAEGGPILFSRAKLFERLGSRDTRKHRVNGIEYNYAVRKQAELLQADIDANSASITQAGFPLVRTIDVTDLVRGELKNKAAKTTFELRVFQNAKGDMPDELLVFLSGDISLRGHGMLVITKE